MKERLLRAYFTEGELMSDRDTLVRLAVEVGLDEDEVREALASGRYADEVRDDERTAGALWHQRRADVRGRPRDRRVGSASARGASGAAAQGMGEPLTGQRRRRRRVLRRGRLLKPPK